MMNTWIVFCAVILLVLSVAWLFYVVMKYGEKEELISHMRTIAYERIALRDDYTIFRNERSAIQWREKTEDLKKILEEASSVFTEKEERAILKEARDHFNATESLFSQFLEYEKRKDFRRPGFDEKEERLIGQVFLRAYSLRDRLSRLHKLTHHKLETTINNGIIIVIIFFIVGGIGITINSFITNLTISKRIELLEVGIGIIGQGNLDYTVDDKGDDEFAELARSFNEMAAKLKASYTSIENLEKEIVARKHIEDLLKYEMERFSILIKNAPFGMVLLDSQGKFLYINPKFKEIFGYDLTEIPDGRTWFRKAFPDPEYRNKAISIWIDNIKAHAKGEPRPRSFAVTCKDEKKKIIDFIAIEFETGAQIITCVDITERTKAEEKISQQLDELQRWHNATLGREMRILELKAEVNELCKRLGEPPRYESAEEKEGGETKGS